MWWKNLISLKTASRKVNEAAKLPEEETQVTREAVHHPFSL
jgi:hypothetical protein